MNSEQFRHQCETRWCITKGAAWFEAYVREVAKTRGRPAAVALLRDVKAQAAAGNTGAPGEWKEVQPA